MTVTSRASEWVHFQPLLVQGGPYAAWREAAARPGLGRLYPLTSFMPSCSQGSLFCHLPECHGGGWSG